MDPHGNAATCHLSDLVPQLNIMPEEDIACQKLI
eukprot:CAMPEP_0115888046 /NCGR_PEP_ID=MMETSP0287-20121206/32099_1 /TAXON_ID=412157 /ORGANISM="Chrysochromulina rotalis, Strain UIO044" /LENGTH=33 /DNA_ID= /DNA_START= /DNA_END= /DNA_ORIENTATION=